jgi:MioC protein
MASVHIIVGSVMGTAEEVAYVIQETLILAGHQVQIHHAFRSGDLPTDPSDILLACTSNTGMGDLPMNIVPFYEHLKNDYPPIAGRRYGIVNLGDSSYPNFAQAGQTLDEALADLGAVRLGDPLVMDAIYVDDHADEARQWAVLWSAEHLTTDSSIRSSSP